MLIFWKKYPHGENLNRTYREKVASSVGCASASLSSLKPLLSYRDIQKIQLQRGGQNWKKQIHIERNKLLQVTGAIRHT